MDSSSKISLETYSLLGFRVLSIHSHSSRYPVQGSSFTALLCRSGWLSKLVVGLRQSRIKPVHPSPYPFWLVLSLMPQILVLIIPSAKTISFGFEEQLTARILFRES